MKLFSSVFIYILNPINISLQFTLCIACLRFVLTQEASRLLVEGQLRAGALLGGSVGVSSLKASDWRSAKKQTGVYSFCLQKSKVLLCQTQISPQFANTFSKLTLRQQKFPLFYNWQSWCHVDLMRSHIMLFMFRSEVGCNYRNPKACRLTFWN